MARPKAPDILLDADSVDRTYGIPSTLPILPPPPPLPTTITIQPQPPSKFLNLPLEIRQQIYTYILHPHQTLHIASKTQWDQDRTTQTITRKTTSTAHTSPGTAHPLLLTNKQLTTELLSILPHHLRLLITFTHSPSTLDLLIPNRSAGPPQPTHPALQSIIPPSLLTNLRHLTLSFPLSPTYSPTYSSSSPAQPRPPKSPFPFHLTPNLRRFALQKSMPLRIDMLHHATFTRDTLVVDRTRPMSRAVYSRLTETQRALMWQRNGLDAKALRGAACRFGSGGWVCCLVMPRIYGPFGGGREEGMGCDGMEEKEGEGKGKGQREERYRDPSGLGVPEGCEVVLEWILEVSAYEGRLEGRTKEIIDRIVFEVGVGGEDEQELGEEEEKNAEEKGGKSASGKTVD